MTYPVPIPNTFQGATGTIPLAQLDANFVAIATALNGIGNGTSALSRVTIGTANVTTLNLPPWTAYQPVVTANAGALGNVVATGASLTVGKTTFVQIDATLANIGNGTAALSITLPSATASRAALAAAEVAVSGRSCSAYQTPGQLGTSTITVSIYDGTTPIAVGNQIVVSGVYQNT